MHLDSAIVFASLCLQPAPKPEQIKTMGNKILLVREPSSKLAEGLVSHIEDQRNTVDAALARKQWNEYQAAFAGWHIEYVAAANDSPDGVFIEDQLLFFASLLEDGRGKPVIVQCNPGAPERRSEVAGASASIERLSKSHHIAVEAISSPGTLDGGDILTVEDQKVVYVGQSARTNQAGRDQLRSILQAREYKVVEVPVTKALHLKSAVTALPDGIVIGFDPLVDDQSLFDATDGYMSIPEEHGCAVVCLDAKNLVISSDAPKTKALLEARGYTVHAVSISEFEKVEGW